MEYLFNELKASENALKRISNPELREQIKLHIECLREQIKNLKRASISDLNDGMPEEPCEEQSASSIEELDKLFEWENGIMSLAG